MRKLKFILKIIRKIEEFSLVFFLSLIIIISGVQIILRIVFRKGIDGFNSILNYSVLWLGLIAAGIATYKNKHIRIDVVGKFVKGKFKYLLYLITEFFAAGVSLLLSVVSVIYIIKIEMTSSVPPPFLYIPRWVLLIIIPLAFGVIGVRFLIASIRYFILFIRKIRQEKIMKEVKL